MEIDNGSDNRTLGQKISDGVAATVGSWTFIGIQSVVLIIWIVLNATGAIPWDPYPFILLNLILSFQAAYTAPIIMMSQNRQSEKDRNIIHTDYLLDKHSNEVLSYVLERLNQQDHLLAEILQKVEQPERKE